MIERGKRCLRGAFCGNALADLSHRLLVVRPLPGLPGVELVTGQALGAASLSHLHGDYRIGIATLGS